MKGVLWTRVFYFLNQIFKQKYMNLRVSLRDIFGLKKIIMYKQKITEQKFGISKTLL
jgi:hypothetical protein